MLAAGIVWSVPRDRDADPAKSLNLAGAACFTAAVMAFVVSTTLITQPARRTDGEALLVICAALAGAFLLIDRRAAAPLLPSRLLGSARLRQGAGAGLLNTATTSSALTLVTLYLQNTLRRSPLEAAAMLVPFSLAVIGGASLSAALLRRCRPQFMIALGLAVIAAADLALLPSAAVTLAVPACAAAAGAGIGLSSVPPPAWAPTSRHTGVARRRASSTPPPSSAPPSGRPSCSCWPRPPRACRPPEGQNRPSRGPRRPPSRPPVPCTSSSWASVRAGRRSGGLARAPASQPVTCGKLPVAEAFGLGRA